LTLKEENKSQDELIVNLQKELKILKEETKQQKE
jgi:hypothetical protein